MKNVDGNNPMLFAVPSQTFKFCLNKPTYIWQDNGKEYWALITYVDATSCFGWRASSFFNKWVMFGLDLSKIDAFTCL